MNIKQAKDYIKNSVNLYLKKDEFGEYRVPVVRQRPIFLLGAPGIGKTAIMEQIAQELGIALVAYSMTHHTRQSALGLPFITEKNYGGKTVSVSEYTMSEIIASIYDAMEQSGMREGILFLDEINCVSETLAPSMLQFLQYKVFGRHQVPEGWVIVTAGNPPEYNKSVREFDVVTYDRLKVLEVEPDFGVWKTYAVERRLHNAIVNYLDLKKEHFYVMEMTTRGRSYVTARGWEDLSEVLYLYEEEELPIEETLVGQYLRNDRVVKEFTAYYDLYVKYKKDYRIEEILKGHPSVQAIARAKEAAFDERLSLLGLLLDRVQADMGDVCEKAAYLSELRKPLKNIKLLVAGEGIAQNAGGEENAQRQTGLSKADKSNADSAQIHVRVREEGLETSAQAVMMDQVIARLDAQIAGREKQLHALQMANSLSDVERRKHRKVLLFLERCRKELFVGDVGAYAGVMDIATPEGAFAYLKQQYDTEVARLRRETTAVQEELHYLFAFAEEAFAGGNELLILVTELTVNRGSAEFIANFGSPDYQRHNQELMLSERQEDLKGQIAALKLE